MDIKTEIILIHLANEWLKSNPERLNKSEQEKFLVNLREYIQTSDKSITDEVFDFLVYYKLIDNNARHISFAKYITNKYNKKDKSRVLDIGAGRVCHLAKELSKSGFKVTAQDPKVRLTDKEAKAKGILKINRAPFVCDDYAKNKKGTIVANFDLLIGLEPCLATEHIIRQGLKYEKPFAILPCYQNHDALNGIKFKTPEDWYLYLKKISSDVEIIDYENSFIITNDKRPFETATRLL